MAFNQYLSDVQMLKEEITQMNQVLQEINA